MGVRPHRTSTAGRAAAVPGAAHRARLGILGEQRFDLRAHDAEVVGVGRQPASRVHVTDHAVPIDEKADARPRPLVTVEPPALQGVPVGVHSDREAELEMPDVAAHGLDIERLGVLVVIQADHDQAVAAVLLVETVQGRRGGAAERTARS
jgi:hypothetical protein